jgi:dTDP-4-dehydrorhamnose reductase
MIWLIGNKGMLGTELSQVFKNRGILHIGTDREVDITDFASLTAFTKNITQPLTWIINCAAYTAVDKAEDDKEICRLLNTDGPANIAQTARSAGAKLLHFSTDYVFNGKGDRPYKEDDITDPIGVYGLTKRDGEKSILEQKSKSYVLRTAWLYGQYGNNFVATMLRLMKENEEVKVVNDQQGSPTWAYDLANITADIIIRTANGDILPYGIYHYTNIGNITWYKFAQEIYSQGKKIGLLKNNCTVTPCTSAEFQARVKRPAYSVLDKGKIQQAFNITIPQWNDSLGRYLEICGN